MTTLSCQPARRYRAPAYPSKLEALADPGMLRGNLPSRWRSRKELAGAAALFLSAGTLGTTGCIPYESMTIQPEAGIVAPPTAVCLSEAAVLDFVKDELARHGVSVEKHVEFPTVQMLNAYDETQTFVADLASADATIAIEYVMTWDDYYLAESGKLDSEEIARRLTAEINAQAPEVYFWAFADPAAALMYETDSCEEVHDVLRAQVRDFVDWLKGQGAI